MSLAETLGTAVHLCFLWHQDAGLKEGIAPQPELAANSQEERCRWHLGRLALQAENPCSGSTSNLCSLWCWLTTKDLVTAAASQSGSTHAAVL